MTPIIATINLQTIDWAIILGFFVIALGIGVYTSRQAGKSESDFFLGGRSMPWWLLGFSMVATTFSTDTPNFVTNIVREHGVASNWMWWSFLLTGMLTVFVYAKLWRRSGVTTDIEFYELRYSGKEAAFLRGFRAIYLGVFFNVIIMASVSLAAIKIGGVMLGLKPWECIVYAAAVTVIFSSMGGFKGVLLTDFLLFIMAMVGAFAAAYYALGHESVGGMAGMVEKLEANGMADKLSIFPSASDPAVYIGWFIIPLAVQWWSVWYPGAEPGGGGYLAQRMLAAKDEKHAVGATLFFNAAHYALRPWPWIIVALCSLLVYPDLDSIKAAFPQAENVGNDSAYSAMLTFLPAGWMGLVLTSLIAAYMSTISTHLNWGSSYIVNDFYLRFLKPSASQKELVWVGRLSTVLLMVIAGTVALFMEDAAKNFSLILQIGAGTGLLFILRWFWWRINAYSEITAMVASFVVALVFYFLPRFKLFADAPKNWAFTVGGYEFIRVTDAIVIDGQGQLVLGVFLTTIAWILVTLVTKPSDPETLRTFVQTINPAGKGWDQVKAAAEAEGQPIQPAEGRINLGQGVLAMSLGCAAVYSFLFATGYFVYGETKACLLFALVTIASSIALYFVWFKRNHSHESE